MQRWLTVNEKIALSTFVKDFELQHESATAKEIAEAATNHFKLEGRDITVFDINRLRKTTQATDAEPRKKRTYKKRSQSQNLKTSESDNLMEEAPSLGGLAKKIKELEEYVEKLQKHQREQLGKIFLA